MFGVFVKEGGYLTRGPAKASHAAEFPAEELVGNNAELDSS